MLLSSLSHHNKDLEWRTLKPPQRVTALGSWTDRVTALLYLEDSRKIHLRGVRACGSKDVKRRASHCVGVERGRDRERTYAWQREREPFGSSFYMFSPSPWACPMQIGLRQERSSTWSPHPGPRMFLWPSSALFSQAFPFLSFSHCHCGLLFPTLTT